MKPTCSMLMRVTPAMLPMDSTDLRSGKNWIVVMC